MTLCNSCCDRWSIAGLTVLAFFFLLSIALSNIAVRNTNKMMPNITWWPSIASSMYIICINYHDHEQVMALMARNIAKYAAEFAQGTPLFWWAPPSQHYSSGETDQHHPFQGIITLLFINNTNINFIVHITIPSSGETAICNIINSINIIRFDLIMTRLFIKNITNMYIMTRIIHTIITNVIFTIRKIGQNFLRIVLIISWQSARWLFFSNPWS